MKRLLWSFSALLFPAAVLAGCTPSPGNGPDNPIGNGDKIEWTMAPSGLEFEAAGDTKEIVITVTSGVPSGESADFDGIVISLAGSGNGWCKYERKNNILKVTADENPYPSTRSTTMSVKFEGKSRQVNITQKVAAEDVERDEKIAVVSATGTSEELGSNPRPFTNSYDGDYVTYFNSKFGEITQWPFFLEYTLRTPNILNYIMYYPRQDSGNKWGSFNKFDVYITTETNPEKVKIASLERGDQNHTPCKIILDTPVENVKTVHFDIHSAYENRVSCGEMEFHKVTGGFDYSAIFNDEFRLTLKPDVTADDIAKIPNEAHRLMAEKIFANEYDTNYRVAEFRPYQHPDEMAASNRIPHAYSLRDNPTGIYVDANEEFYVMVGDTGGQNISLVIQNLSLGWSSNKTFELRKGENKIKTPISGLLYVINLTKEPIPLFLETDADKAAAAAMTVKMHFVNGKVQGYYRKGVTSLTEWKRMITAARYTEIDVVGDYAHVSWLTRDYKSKPDNVATIIEKIDGLVWQQLDFCGLVKYGKIFRNRMYIMYADIAAASATKYRTNYNANYGEIFTTPDRYSARLWVLGHEVGHINQVGIRWAGTTEVSNNIYSLYNQKKELGAANRLTTGSYANEKTLSDGTVYSDIYEASIAAIVTAGQPHCADMTPLPNADGSENTNENLAHWLKLVPFWQLQLYVADALGDTDFYADVYEYYRTCSPAANTLSHGEQQLLFTEICCRSANLDLTDFFEKWGFFRPINRDVNDYGTKRMTVTKEMADATKARIAAAGYPAPTHTADEIIAIRDTNLANYKK